MSKTFLSAGLADEIKKMDEMVREGLSDTKAMADGEFTEAEVKEYALTLLTQYSYETVDEEGKAKHFFAVADHEGMPSDAWVDYVKTPTYIASGIVILSVLKDKSFLDNELVRKELPCVLRACAHGGFGGHGYDSNRAFVETMDLFRALKIKEFVEMYLDICQEFTEEYKEAVKTLHDMSQLEEDEMGWSAFDLEKAKELDKYYSKKIK